MLLELGGRYLALLPMASGQCISQFYIEKGQLRLKSGNFGTERIKGDVPRLAWAYGKSPYEATHLAWKKAIESGYVATEWRQNKSFPEMYQYLGWCSWEHYKTRISDKVLTDAVQTIENCGAPIRWVIVDDGYLTHEKGQIIEFTPDRKKFPNGWKSITGLKKPDKIKWMGVWRNFLGYMSAVSPKHKMDDIREFLVPNARKKVFVPDGTKTASKAFFDKMIVDSKENGFDFTKVDFQTRAFEQYHGMNNAVTTMTNNSEALENACKNHRIPLLNCIAQTSINVFQTRYSALTRTSPDYNQSDKDKNKCNTYQSFANHLWMGQTVWGDLDMFHSHASDAEVMAIARAISGGPVYVSDEPSKIVPDLLKKFCYEDGWILRTKAPAALLPESYFIHPFREEKAFRVIAPLEDNVAAIGLFNFTEGGNSVKASFSSKDYPHAGELLLPYQGKWKLPDEGLLAYDPSTEKVLSLDQELGFEVSNFSGKLFLIYPKTKGWAVIGRPDKYLPAAAVKIKTVTEDSITFTMKEAGPLMVWSEKGAPKMDGVEFKPIGNGLYKGELTKMAGQLTLTR